MPLSSNRLQAGYRTATGRPISSKAYVSYQEIVHDWNLINWSVAAPARATIAGAIKSDPKLKLNINTIFFFEQKKILCKDGSVKRNDTSNRLKALYDCLSKQVLLIEDKYFWAGSFDKAAAQPGEQESVAISIKLR